jgi:HEAT repeat protein
MMESLKRDDPVLNQLAAEALAAIGPDVVHVLMCEILSSVNVQYRLRLLEVIAEIGEMPDPNDHLELFNLTHNPDVRVRTEAARAIYAVGPRGPRRRCTVPEVTPSR